MNEDQDIPLAPVPDAPPVEVSPAGWGDEVRWVHQNYERVVEEDGPGDPIFHWERAKDPPPTDGSRSLMKWASRNRTKFYEICGRVFRDEESQREDNIRREDKSLREVRAILGKYKESEAKEV